MNVERLHLVAYRVKEEIDSLDMVPMLSTLLSGIQQMVNNPADPASQQQVASIRTQLQERLPKAATNMWPPSERQILEELDLDDVLGSILLERIEEIFTRNEMTPSVAADDIAPIRQKVEEAREQLDRLLDGFEYFEIGKDELVDEVEVSISIPRHVHDELAGLGKELVNLKRLLGAFQELALGHREDIEVRAMSSSNFTFFLATAPAWAFGFAKGVQAILETYDTVLDIQLKRQALVEEDGLPEEALASVNEYASNLMENRMREVAEQLVKEAHNRLNAERKNELTNDVTLALNALANRVGEGYAIDVRVPETDENEEAGEEDGGSTPEAKTLGAIREISASIKFFPPPSKRILELPEPEGLESSEDDETNEREEQ